MDMKITFPGGKKVDAEFEHMRVHTDQSVKSGGEGTAPEPYKLLLAAIGTCAGYYVLSFCQKRSIPTTKMHLNQRNVFEPTSSGKYWLARVELEIIIPPDFPEKYLDALVRAADQCAVRQSLLDPPKIEVSTRRAR